MDRGSMAHAASQLKKKADENLAAEEEKEKEKKKTTRKRSREVKKKVRPWWRDKESWMWRKTADTAWEMGWRGVLGMKHAVQIAAESFFCHAAPPHIHTALRGVPLGMLKGVNA